MNLKALTECQILVLVGYSESRSINRWLQPAGTILPYILKTERKERRCSSPNAALSAQAKAPHCRGNKELHYPVKRTSCERLEVSYHTGVHNKAWTQSEPTISTDWEYFQIKLFHLDVNLNSRFHFRANESICFKLSKHLGQLLLITVPRFFLFGSHIADS